LDEEWDNLVLEKLDNIIQALPLALFSIFMVAVGLWLVNVP